MAAMGLICLSFFSDYECADNSKSMDVSKKRPGINITLAAKSCSAAAVAAAADTAAAAK